MLHDSQYPFSPNVSDLRQGIVSADGAMFDTKRGNRQLIAYLRDARIAAILAAKTQ